MAVNPMIGASLLSGAGGLLSSALGIDQNRKAEERSWLRTLQLQKMQNDFNVDMWNRTNAYNAPTNQLRLLKEAGLNPAMYQAAQQTPASEVTASDASSPMNSEQGRLYQNLAQLNPVGQMINVLSSEAQIAKLRTDIKYQELLNRDFQHQLDAKEELYNDDSIIYDEFGNPVVTVTPSRNAYQEERRRSRASMIEQEARAGLSDAQLEVYQATKPFLKKMPEQQLNKLVEDVQAAVNNNAIVGREVELMRKYGISPNDKDGFMSLLRIALTDPSAFGRIIDAVIGDVPSSIVEGVLHGQQRLLQRGINSMRGYGNKLVNPNLNVRLPQRSQ